MYLACQTVNIFTDEGKFNKYLREQNDSFNQRMLDRQFEEEMMQKFRRLPRFKQASELPNLKQRIRDSEEHLMAKQQKKMDLWVNRVGPIVAVGFIVVHVLVCFCFMRCFRKFQRNLQEVEEHALNRSDSSSEIQMQEQSNELGATID